MPCRLSHVAPGLTYHPCMATPHRQYPDLDFPRCTVCNEETGSLFPVMHEDGPRCSRHSGVYPQWSTLGPPDLITKRKPKGNK